MRVSELIEKLTEIVKSGKDPEVYCYIPDQKVAYRTFDFMEVINNACICASNTKKQKHNLDE